METIRKAAGSLLGQGDNNDQKSGPSQQTHSAGYSSTASGSMADDPHESGFPKGFPTPASHDPYHSTTTITTDLRTGTETRPHASQMGKGMTECSCGGDSGVCSCDPGKCACAGCTNKNSRNPMAGAFAHGPEHGKGAVLKEDVGMGEGMSGMKEGMKEGMMGSHGKMKQGTSGLGKEEGNIVLNK